MKCISVNTIILIILFFMQSCIKEDISECHDNALRLRIRYTLNNQYTDLFGAEVRSVMAYVFDKEGKYVESYYETGDKLTHNYIMTIPMPKGQYRVVVVCDNLKTFSAGWIDNKTNSFSKDFQAGVTKIEDFRIMLNNKEGNEGYLVPESLPGDLYVGYVDNAVSSNDSLYSTNVDLMKDTKNITVKISGLDALTRSITAPDIYITAINARYKSDNSIDSPYRMFKYTPHNVSISGNSVESNLKTMRLVVGNAPMLVIKHPAISGYLLNKDITELILSNPKYVSQEDIDREDTFLFEINASQTGNNIEISISINGWEINTVIPTND